MILQLEGWSQELAWQYRESTPKLQKLANDSIFFQHFYTSSVEPVFTLCDVFYGDSSVLDHNTNIHDVLNFHQFAEHPENLFDILEEEGKITHSIGFLSAPFILGGTTSGLARTAARMDTTCETADCFYVEIEKFLDTCQRKRRSFALYCLVDGKRKHHETEVNISTQMRQRYAVLEDSVSFLVDALKRRNLFTESYMAVFGNSNQGLVNRYTQFGPPAPYAEVSWMPMFLRGPGLEAGLAPVLASTIDLHKSLRYLLGCKERKNENSGMFAGVNLFTEKRDLVFCQNLPALHTARGGMVKGYAVTDGDTRIVTSSVGTGAVSGGTELFFDAMDPGNNRNLLDFFIINQDGMIKGFDPRDAVHMHFLMSFQNPKAANLARIYQMRIDILRRFIKEKENAARLRNKGAWRYSFPDVLSRRSFTM